MLHIPDNLRAPQGNFLGQLCGIRGMLQGGTYQVLQYWGADPEAYSGIEQANFSEVNNQERPVFNPNISDLLPAPFKIPGNPHAAMKVTVGSICRIGER